MCGFIVGQNIKQYNISSIEYVLDKIKHRGPDDGNIVFLNNGHMFFGHRRLSIVGIDNGKQPITSNDENIIIVVNGEFYDHELIRLKMSHSGYVFKTKSDSEILIPLYEKYGFKCLDFLHDEFSFTLYDKKKNLWFSARDRMGIRPLNYFFDKNQIIFSSEAKAILPLLENPELDKKSLWFSQHFQYLPQNNTLFKNIEMLPPATYMIIKDNKKELVNYWELPSTETNDSFEEASQKIEWLLYKAVEKRIPNEVKWCTHLSGGIDSSIVTYLSNEINKKNNPNQLTESFTVSFTDDGFYNELPLAQEVSTMLGINLNIVPVSFEDALKVMPSAIYHGEGLSINGHIGAKYLLNKEIKNRGFKVALTGEGSDEIFMGYSHLKQDFLSFDNLNKMEKNYLGGVQLPSGQTMNLNDLEKLTGFVPTWIKAKSSMAFKFSKLWHNEFIGQGEMDLFIQESDYVNNFKKHGKNKMASLLWSKYCLSGYILKVLDDAQSMAFSIEGRLPFLDTDLMNYVWSLPNEYYFKGDIEKYLLRNLYKDKLPVNIINKTKQSFMSPPIQRALKDKKMNKFITDYLLENSHFEKQKIFDRNELIKAIELWKNDESPTVEPILMTILSIAMFCSEFKL